MYKQEAGTAGPLSAAPLAPGVEWRVKAHSQCRCVF